MPRLSHSPPETFHHSSHASLLVGIFFWSLMLSKKVSCDLDYRCWCIRSQFYVFIQSSVTCKRNFVTYCWRIVSAQVEPSLGRYTYLLTYLLTYSVEQIPSWGAYSFLLVKEISSLYGMRLFITAFTMTSHLSVP